MPDKRPLSPVSVYINWRIRRLMKLAIARGDYDSMSEIGRLSLQAWAIQYAAQLAGQDRKTTRDVSDPAEIRVP